MSFSSSTTDRLYATCTHGLEGLLQQELTALGISDVECSASGVYLPYSIENIYLVNYCSRIATRLLLPLARFSCTSREALYKSVFKIDWSRFLSLEKSFAVDANIIETPAFKNSHFAALVVKDAICDQMRQRTGGRPSIDTKRPAIQLNLFINRGEATLNLDTSGAPLYKRGWRAQTTEAPLQETLAAALLLGSGYKAGDILFDPFCGSGTLLVEAAMIASQTPAGFYRKWWGFFYLPDHSEEAWLHFKQQQDAKRQPLPKDFLLGADRNQEALDSAYENLCRAGFDKATTLIARDIKQLRHPVRPTLIITNPPYGVRLEADLETLQALGQWIQKQRARTFILYPDEPGVEEALGLSCKRMLSFYNGGLKVALWQTGETGPHITKCSSVRT